MHLRLFRIGLVTALAALALGGVFSAPPIRAQETGIGSNPGNAQDFGVRNAVMVSVLRAGATRWFKASPGFEQQRVSATLQTNPWVIGQDTSLLHGANEGESGRVAVFVNFQGSADALGGQQDKDARGFTRVGFLTHTRNSGPDRVFHAITAPLDQSRTIYYKLVNTSRVDVSYAFSVEHSSCQPGACTDPAAQDPKTWGPLPPPSAILGQ